MSGAMISYARTGTQDSAARCDMAREGARVPLRGARCRVSRDVCSDFMPRALYVCSSAKEAMRERRKRCSAFIMR